MFLMFFFININKLNWIFRRLRDRKYTFSNVQTFRPYGTLYLGKGYLKQINFRDSRILNMAIFRGDLFSQFQYFLQFREPLYWQIYNHIKVSWSFGLVAPSFLQTGFLLKKKKRVFIATDISFFAFDPIPRK